jgi:hypothetical protein
MPTLFAVAAPVNVAATADLVADAVLTVPLAMAGRVEVAVEVVRVVADAGPAQSQWSPWETQPTEAVGLGGRVLAACSWSSCSECSSACTSAVEVAVDRTEAGASQSQ